MISLLDFFLEVKVWSFGKENAGKLCCFWSIFQDFFKFWLLKVEVFTSKPYIIQIYMKSKQSYNFLSLKEQTKGQID